MYMNIELRNVSHNEITNKSRHTVRFHNTDNLLELKWNMLQASDIFSNVSYFLHARSYSTANMKK